MLSLVYKCTRCMRGGPKHTSCLARKRICSSSFTATQHNKDCLFQKPHQLMQRLKNTKMQCASAEEQDVTMPKHVMGSTWWPVSGAEALQASPRPLHVCCGIWEHASSQ